MPRLSSWGKGGYRRSSLAKRIRDILNLGNEPPDSQGIDRITMGQESDLGPWNYGPEVPNVSPVLTYHHQFDFNDADDVDLVDTWQESKVGNGASMGLYFDGSRYVALLRAGSSEGDVTQYQEKNFAYYSEAAIEQDIFFKATLGYQTDAGKPESELYIGFTSTSADAISTRDYGMGFHYDPETQIWSFVMENQAADPPLISQNVLLSTQSIDEGVRVKITLAFRLAWRAGDARDRPELKVYWEIEPRITYPGGTVETDSGGFSSWLSQRYQIREQALRLTFGAKQTTDVPPVGNWGTLIMPWILKEIIPKVEGLSREF